MSQETHTSAELIQAWKNGRRTQSPLGLARVTASRQVFSQTAPATRHAARLEQLKFRKGIRVIDGGVIAPGMNMFELAARLKTVATDAVEIGFGNYGCEQEVATLCRELGVPVLLAAPYDGPPNADGTRETDAWCGFMPASKLLADYGVYYYDFVGQSVPGSPREMAKFGDFVATARAVRSMSRVRIGQVGGNQPTFPAIGVSPEVLGSRFDVEVVPIDLGELFDRIEGLMAVQSLLDAEVEGMRARGINTDAVPPENLHRIAAAVIAELELAIKYNLDGLTHNCWPYCMERHQLMFCMVGGELLRLGLPCACETDKGGLLTLMGLQALDPCGSPPMFADITITVIDEGGVAILVWHCGPFPSTNCRDCAACQGWIIPTSQPAYAYLDGVGKFPEGTPMTLTRFGNRNGAGGIAFSMAAFEAPVVAGPKTLGTHFYVGVSDETFDQLEEALVLGVNGQWKTTVHHFGVAEGAKAHLVDMTSRFLGLGGADIFLPAESEIARRRRGTGLSRLLPA